MVIRKKKVKPAHPCQRAGTKAGQKTIYAASATIIPVLLDVESERPRRLKRDLDRPSVLAMLRRPTLNTSASGVQQIKPVVVVSVTSRKYRRSR
jgi:hypothetical protein